jgi:hypothetical protein
MPCINGQQIVVEIHGVDFYIIVVEHADLLHLGIRDKFQISQVHKLFLVRPQVCLAPKRHGDDRQRLLCARWRLWTNLSPWKVGINQCELRSEWNAEVHSKYWATGNAIFQRAVDVKG